MKRSEFDKQGKGPEDAQKAKHGGNRAGDHMKSSGKGADKSSQAAGKDPHRSSR
jgi:hypothetical protein